MNYNGTIVVKILCGNSLVLLFVFVVSDFHADSVEDFDWLITQPPPKAVADFGLIPQPPLETLSLSFAFNRLSLTFDGNWPD